MTDAKYLIRSTWFQDALSAPVEASVLRILSKTIGRSIVLRTPKASKNFSFEPAKGFTVGRSSNSLTVGKYDSCGRRSPTLVGMMVWGVRILTTVSLELPSSCSQHFDARLITDKANVSEVVNSDSWGGVVRCLSQRTIDNSIQPNICICLADMFLVKANGIVSEGSGSVGVILAGFT